MPASLVVPGRRDQSNLVLSIRLDPFNDKANEIRYLTKTSYKF